MADTIRTFSISVAYNQLIALAWLGTPYTVHMATVSAAALQHDDAMFCLLQQWHLGGAGTTQSMPETSGRVDTR